MSKFRFPRRRRCRQTPGSVEGADGCAFTLHDDKSPGVSLHFFAVSPLPSVDRSAARRLWCAFRARTMPARGARRFQPLRLLTASKDRRRRGSSDVLCATSAACYHGDAVTRQRTDDEAPGRAAPGNTGGFMSALKASLWLHPGQQGGAQPSLLNYHENASPFLITTSMLRQPHPPSTQQKPLSHLL